MAHLNKFGAVADAVGPDAVIIAATAVPAGGEAQITDFGITSAQDPEGATGLSARLQVDDNAGFASPTTVAEQALDAAGTFIQTFDSPIVVPGGQFFRVVGTADAPGNVSAELSGTARPQAIIDA